MTGLKFSIHRLGAFGDCAYYQRDWREPGLKRFICIDTRTNTIIGEFETKRQAASFAVTHSDLSNFVPATN